MAHIYFGPWECSFSLCSLLPSFPLIFTGNNLAYAASHGVPLCVAQDQIVGWSKEKARFAVNTNSFHKTVPNVQTKNHKRHLQGVFQCVVKFHDGCLVPAAITIVRCTEDRHHIAVVTPIVTLDQKMTWILFTLNKTCIRSASNLKNEWLADAHSRSTSITSWWALETNVRPFAWLKVSEMSCPKV